MGTNLMRALLLTSASVAMVATAAPTAAYAQEATYQIDIPAQSMGDALRALGKATKQNIVFNGSLVKGKRSAAVRGRMSASGALERMLAGSGLKMSRGSGGGLVVQGGNGEVADSASSYGEGAASSEAGVSEILVVGSRSQNVDIRRTETGIQPYVVFGQDEIAQSQASTIDEFLKSRISMDTRRESLGQLDPGYADTGQINLRGLGTDQTLILVDGRRIPSVANSDRSFGQPNISGIPIGAIDRVEILPTTAGGIYGGGAVGGVVNIILKRDFKGIDLQAQYGNSFNGDMHDIRLDLNGGFSLESGKTSVVFGASYQEHGTLLVSERDFAERGRALAFKNDPDRVLASFLPGSTANVCGASIFQFPTFSFGFCNGQSLTLDNGQALNSSFTYVPEGYAGPQSDAGAAFLKNAGQVNIDVPKNGDTILRAPTTWSVNANVRRSFTSRLDLYAEARFDSTESQSSRVGYENLLLTADDPANPFQQDILIASQVPGLEYPATNKLTNLILSTGAVYRPSSTWSLGLDYSWATSRSKSTSTILAILPATRALIAPEALRDLDEFPLELNGLLLPTPQGFNGPSAATLQDAAIRAGGTVVNLPAGPVTVSASAMARSERLSSSLLVTRGTQVADSIVFLPGQDQKVYAAYVETRVPLVASDMHVPGINTLELEASLRRDWYRLKGSTDQFVLGSETETPPNATYAVNKFASSDYTLGAKYAPLDAAFFRGSWATGFKPPSVAQLTSFSGVVPATSLTITDPLRNNTPLSGDANGLIAIASGGNANLKPEKSKSISFGIVATPKLFDSFKVSVDYTRVSKTNEIVSPLLDSFIADESQFPGRVTRGANLPTDPVGIPGPIIAIDATAVNAARSSSAAVDFQLDLENRIGRFGSIGVSGVGTLSTSFRREVNFGSRLVNLVGYSDFGAPLKWRFGGNIYWKRGPWLVSFAGQYYSSYRITFADAGSESLNPSRVKLQGSETIPDQAYFDVYARYRFKDTDSAILSGTEIAVGVQNIFNHKPPLLATIFPSGGYSTYGDPRLRRFTISLRHSFDLKYLK